MAPDTDVSELSADMTLAPRIARGVVVTVFFAVCLVGFLHVLMQPVGAVGIVVSFSCMAALLLLQLVYFARSRGPRDRWTVVALVVQACLVYVPILQFKQAWVGMPGFLAGSVLLVLPPVVGWTAFVLIVVSMGAAQLLLNGSLVDMSYTSVSTVITGLVVYGLSRLSDLVHEVHRARTELAQMAVAQERLRIARDLHDLLGYSLSAITLKSELTHRLVTKHPARARAELQEILDISRRTLVDVRSVASGYRELSLDDECRSAHSVLTAADVDVRMDVDYSDLPVRVSTVLATVLREGITNVLRHSKAERCEITLFQDEDEVHIEIRNDGVAASAGAPAESSGTGLDNLAARVHELGGRISAEVGTENDYRLRVRAPLRVEQDLSHSTAA
ncbi:sensor histidine kinase [Parasphingorhabdus pacifica]